MKISEEIFNHRKINYNTLIKNGFSFSNNEYVLKKFLLNDEFYVIIKITDNITAKLYDSFTNEEYINIDISDFSGKFIGKLRQEYTILLTNIKNRCTYDDIFMYPQSINITNYIKSRYNTNPEFLWKAAPHFGVFRKEKNKKWFAIIMEIPKNKIDKSSVTDMVEIINVKNTPEKIKQLNTLPGFYTAYHMNKKNWTTIILNDSVDTKLIFDLIEESYNLC